MRDLSGSIEMKGNGHESLSKWPCVQNDEAQPHWWTHGSQSGNLWSSRRTLLRSDNQNVNHCTAAQFMKLHYIQWCATVLSLWEHFILLFWSAASYSPACARVAAAKLQICEPGSIVGCIGAVAQLLLLTASHSRVDLSDGGSGNLHYLFNF